MENNNSDNSGLHFVELDRPKLERIGFRNTFINKKNKKGIERMEDTRSDFKSALRFLRKAKHLSKGLSLDDISAHYVVIKLKTRSLISTKNLGGSGCNKQTVWVRNDVLEEWIKTSTSAYGKNLKNRQNVHNGLVYFITVENNTNVVKIGYTTNLVDRFNALQTGNHCELTVYKTIKNVPRRLEKKLHRFFSKYRIRGEWFKITTDQIDDVCLSLSNK